MKPREYQVQGVNSIVRLIADGYKRICVQMATGAGKTVMFSYFLQRYLNKYPNNISRILVHRDILGEQAYEKMQKFGVKNVSVHMIETFNNQLKKGNYLNTDLIIIDEAHRGEMKKIFEHFPDATIIGFTATPIASSKKHPMKADYEQIVVCVDIMDLIQIHERDQTQGLVPAHHYCPPNQLNKKEIKKSGGEYNMRSMSDALSKTKLVDAVLANYVKIGENLKTVVFNSLIDHSLKVNECFTHHGYDSKHLDGKMSKDEQKEIYKWFKDTPNAILQSVDMATTGFDEPSIINVIPNRLTLSLPLWLQMGGRGARPYENKKHFNLIDPVGNVSQHGYWHRKHDWFTLFHYPDKPGNGVAPMKECPGIDCGCMIYMSTTICPFCGHVFPRETIYSDMVIELQLVPDSLIVPKNSPITMEKTIISIANNVKTKPIDLYDKRKVMESAIKKLHKQSDQTISTNMAVHLSAKFI